jgi:hypothetical protein
MLIIFGFLMNETSKRIIHELKHHIPFTIFGASTGIALIAIIFYSNLINDISSISENIFFILHPTHIFLSAIATTTIYLRYSKKNVWLALIVGYTGAIVIATISDSLIPYIGELILNLPKAEAHIGFIEEPILTNVPAFIGIALGYFKGYSKFPHGGHVLISTWASLFHIIMAIGTTISIGQTAGIFIFLFLAVWLPCCTSDIVYPLIFTNKSPKFKEKKKEK